MLDIEAVPASNRSGDFDDVDLANPFDITITKNASVERLRRWRQSTLVLNASRRFRYTLDLEKEEEKQQKLIKIRAHAQTIRAAYLFKAASERAGLANETINHPLSSTAEFPIGQEQLGSISRDHDTTALHHFGGVAGISNLLKTDLEKGIHNDDAELLKRRNAFGSNNYPQKKGANFLMFLWDACKDLTLIILIVAAAASLELGIQFKGIKEGWYGGGSIAFSVIFVIVVTVSKLPKV